MIIFQFSCDRPGNVGAILSFNTNIREAVTIAVTDSMQSNNIWVPPPYFKDSITHHEHLEYRLFHFPEDPEELYFVTFSGGVSIRYVYNFKQRAWQSRLHEFTREDHMRIKHRMYRVLEQVRDLALAQNIGFDEIFVNYNQCVRDVLDCRPIQK